MFVYHVDMENSYMLQVPQWRCVPQGLQFPSAGASGLIRFQKDQESKCESKHTYLNKLCLEEFT